jgi:hypothetical protein
VCLLSTRNHGFAKFRIKNIRIDSATEFSSRAFNNYCMAQGIEVRHSVPYVHTQNDLTEPLINRINPIARPLLQGCNLPTSYWGHAIQHAVDLVQLRSTVYHTTFLLQLVCGDQPSISHMWKFVCAVYTPISTMLPLTCDLFTTRFADYIFNEDYFMALGRDNKFINDGREINWDDKSIISFDPCTKETEFQVQKIIQL